MANDATPSTDKTGTRPRVIDYSYRYRKDSESAKEHGETGKRITIDVESVILKLIGDKEGTFDGEFEGLLAPLFPDGELPEPCMAIPTAAYGLKTTLGNAVSAPAVKEAGSEKQLEAIRERYNTIAEDKEWREGREGGPRLAYVVDAYRAHLESKHGKPLTERQLVALRASVIAKTTTEVLKNPHVRAEYDAAEVRRLEARAAESKAKASQLDTSAADADEAAILDMN